MLLHWAAARCRRRRGHFGPVHDPDPGMMGDDGMMGGARWLWMVLEVLLVPAIIVVTAVVVVRKPSGSQPGAFSQGFVAVGWVSCGRQVVWGG